MSGTLKTTSSSNEVSAFIQQHKTISKVVKQQQRLLFVIDATASRQPTWDLACSLTHSLLHTTDGLKGLTLKLCFYRGFEEFRQTDWLTDADALSKKMSSVHCMAGQTQIRKTLRHALKEHQSSPLRGLIFIGDAIEEPPHEVINLAGQCGLRTLPLFLFQEGLNPTVEDIFQHMARLSSGAYARFDLAAPDRLRDLLSAVAAYAQGGYTALTQRRDAAAQTLLEQLPRS
ncbi:MAG: VWA domain-containing protein [Halieaceae bacterium]|nr:VWA domain-containing protein [Halieaceae bacterium]